MTPTLRACWGMFAVAAFLCVTASTAIAGVEVDVPPVAGDDRANIQAALTAGNIVRLSAGQPYQISGRLDVTKNGSGIVTRGAPAILQMSADFRNFDPLTMFCTKVGVDGCEVARTDSIAIYAENVTDLVLENFKIEKVHHDGTYVAGIWLRGVTRGTLAGLELSNFSLGAIVALDSVHEVAIRGCTIHDSWASILPNKTRFPQLTGIWIDDNRLLVNGVRIPSTDVVIANNTISKLRFQRGLFEMKRNLFAGMEQDNGAVGHQTDAITVGPPATNVKIVANVIDVVGEGIDSMGTKVRIEQNRITNSYDCALKFIHGANHNIAYRNTLGAAGYDTICMAGTTLDSSGDTFGNLISENEITNVGDRTAYCGANVDPAFSVPCPTDRPAFAVYIQTSPSPAKRPYFNLVQGNRIATTSRMGGLFGVEPRADYSLFFGNVFTGRNIANAFDPTAVGTEFDPSADRLAVGDFDKNGLDDSFVHWSASGKNRLYRDIIRNGNREVAISQDLIAPGAINTISGAPAQLLSGDFDGDKRTDLFFFWKGTGTNRVFYGNSNVDFTQIDFTKVENPIDPGAINGSPDSTLTGDFDNDGRTDLLFHWKQPGTNRVFYGNGRGSFTKVENPIDPTGINGSPDFTVTGDFDGDKRTDLLFFWKATGNNRFFFSTGRAFEYLGDRIPPGGVNQSPNQVIPFDANFDGRTDLDFFWYASGQRRLYLGQANRSFVE